MDVMDLRRKLLQKKESQHILPSEYQQVEYIEGTGTQNIQLPYGFDDTDIIRFSVGISLDNYGADFYMLCPNTWNNNRNRFAMAGVFSDSDLFFAIGYGEKSTNNTILSPSLANDGNIHLWIYRNHIFETQGSQYNVSDIYFGGTTSNLKLFYGYNRTIKGKVNYYKHIKANGDRYELIPCYRKADGVIGMYDIANGVFYTNNGTGTFIKGQDV